MSCHFSHCKWTEWMAQYVLRRSGEVDVPVLLEAHYAVSL